METTRHFVATVYVVVDGATALHRHDKLDMWLPPGGHIDRGEVPHMAAIREAREELGMSIELLEVPGEFDTDTVRSLPRAEHVLLEDINVHPSGEVGHQHVDFVFYGEAPTREIDPEPGEQPAEDWKWFDKADLELAGNLEPDVREIGQRAIDAIEVDNGTAGTGSHHRQSSSHSEST